MLSGMLPAVQGWQIVLLLLLLSNIAVELSVPAVCCGDELTVFDRCNQALRCLLLLYVEAVRLP
jgi:hypothetical protein